MYIVTVDEEKCTACGDCIEGCPSELLSMVEDGGQNHAKYTADPEDCIGCYSCESGCPEGAITITEN